jgi:hypothetical protein
MSTSERPPQRPGLWIYWVALAAAFGLTAAIGGRVIPQDARPAVQGLLGIGFLVLLLWSAKRGGWLKGLVITLAVLALAFGICVAIVVGSFE